MLNEMETKIVHQCLEQHREIYSVFPKQKSN